MYMLDKEIIKLNCDICEHLQNSNVGILNKFDFLKSNIFYDFLNLFERCSPTDEQISNILQPFLSEQVGADACSAIRTCMLFYVGRFL